MVNDKNRLYTNADVTKDAKFINKVKTQQQFSRFSIAESSAVTVVSETAPPTALQIDTKPQIGNPINDTIGSIGLITQIIFLDVFGSDYSTMTITDDVTFAFNKIPQGRHIPFTIDFVIDTGTPPTVTLDSRVINPPTLPTLTDTLRVVLHFIGVRDDVDTRFTYIGGTVDSGGAGVSFPITPPVDARGNVNTNQDIDLSATTAHITKMTLTGNIAITFSSIPATNTQIEWEIEIKQDGTGGRTVTWPAEVVSIPTIDQNADAITLVVLRTNDNGTTINTLFSSLGSVSNVSQWATFSAVQDIDYATFDGINIDRLRFVSSSGAVASADDPSILLDGSSNMIFNIADQKQWFWTNSDETIMQLNREGVNNDTVLTVETGAGDVSAIPRIDIFRDDPSPVINDEFGKLRFVGTDLALAAQVYSEIAVEYESVTTGRIASSMIFVTSFDTGATTQFKPFMVINSANDERIRMIEDVEIVQNIILQAGLDTSKLFFDGGGDTYFTGSGTSGRINVVNDNTNTMFFANDRFELTATRNLIINTGFLRMGDRADPTAGVNEGMFYVKDVAGISRPFFVGDGLAAVDLSEGGANTTLSNLVAPTSVNRDLIPDQATGGNLGSATATENWFNIHLGRVQFTAKMSEITTQGSIQLVNNAGNDDMIFNVPSATVDRFVWDMSGVAQMTLTATELILDGVNLDLENNNITDANQIQITGASGDIVRGFLSGVSGALEITSDENSSSVKIFTRNSGGVVTLQLEISDTILDSRNPLVFGAVDALGGSEHGICQDANGTRINAATSNLIVLSINNNGRFSMSDTDWGGQASDNFKLFVVSSGARAGINLQNVAGDPTTVADGDMWYNDTTNKMRIREGGVSKDMV